MILPSLSRFLAFMYNIKESINKLTDNIPSTSCNTIFPMCIVDVQKYICQNVIDIYIVKE